jgi:hypothetical protein
MEVWMAAVVTAPARPGRLEVPAWAWAVFAVAVALLWLVTMEGSFVSNVIGGTPSFLHELFHDGRHLLGVPCH